MINCDVLLRCNALTECGLVIVSHEVCAFVLVGTGGYIIWEFLIYAAVTPLSVDIPSMHSPYHCHQSLICSPHQSHSKLHTVWQQRKGRLLVLLT